MLCVRKLGKRLEEFALRGVSFDVEKGDYFVLLGASGVGKTLLLEILAGLTPPDEGSVTLNGRDITYERIQRRRMGLVYQNQALFPHLNVRQNIAFGLRRRKFHGAARRDRVQTLAADVGVSDLLHRYPDTLSGGEAQRVALARTLATKPRCLLLDEPISSLDMQARADMRALLRSLNRDGHTMVHVTHDYEEAMALASRVGIMEKGTITQVGTPNEVFHHPKSEFVARFVGIRNSFEGRLEVSDNGNGSLARFVTGDLAFTILTDAQPGPGHLVFRSEDLVVSKTKQETSAQNCFKGTIVDMAPARLGIEVTIDIGVNVAALVTSGSVTRMGMDCGQQVWVSLKASAAKYIEM